MAKTGGFYALAFWVIRLHAKAIRFVLIKSYELARDLVALIKDVAGSRKNKNQ